MKNKRIFSLIVLFLIITFEGVFIWQNKLVPRTEEEKERLEEVKERREEKRLAVKNYSESLKVWKELKKTRGASYIYKTKFISWAGYKNETKITIKNDVPVAREFQESFMSYLEDAPTPEFYSENIENLGTNKKGSPAVTIDNLYKECEKKLKASYKHSYVTFKMNGDGIIKSCGYTPLNCADDCFEGVSIDEFEWIK